MTSALARMRTANSSQSLKGEAYFRIVPLTIKFTGPIQNVFTNKWVLYLEKGMQILGKTTVFQANETENSYTFLAQQNSFDFQIASEKNLNYTFSLYAVDNSNYQERIGAQTFSIKQSYQKYEKENSRKGDNFTLKIKQNAVLEIKLLIQNTYLMWSQVQKIVPESTPQEINKALLVKNMLSMILGNKPRQSVTNNQKPYTSQIVDPKGKKQILKVLFQYEQQKQNTVKSSINEEGQKRQNSNTQEEITPLINRVDQRSLSSQAMHKENGLQKIVEDKKGQDTSTPLFDIHAAKSFSQYSDMVEQKQKQTEIKLNKIQQQLKQEAEGQNQHYSVVTSQNTSQLVHETTNKHQYPNIDQPNIQNFVQQIKSQSQEKNIKENIQQPSTQQNNTQQPQILTASQPLKPSTKINIKKIIVGILFLFLITGIIGALWQNQSIQDQQKQPEIPKPKSNKKKTKKINKNKE